MPRRYLRKNLGNKVRVIIDALRTLDAYLEGNRETLRDIDIDAIEHTITLIREREML